MYRIYSKSVPVEGPVSWVADCLLQSDWKTQMHQLQIPLYFNGEGSWGKGEFNVERV